MIQIYGRDKHFFYIVTNFPSCDAPLKLKSGRNFSDHKLGWWWDDHGNTILKIFNDQIKLGERPPHNCCSSTPGDAIMTTSQLCVINQITLLQTKSGRFYSQIYHLCRLCNLILSLLLFFKNFFMKWNRILIKNSINQISSDRPAS